ncbi:MAG: malate dehydrogenase, partial [Oscillospiraceae bacterium]|jgi:malate dehydrogenase
MKIFIIGAGTLGSTTAYLLAERALADEILLYDDYMHLARHHAMDISQAVCASGGTTVRCALMDEIAGSDIVISACGYPQSDYKNDLAADTKMIAPLVKSVAETIARYAPCALVLSLTNPLDTANYLLYKYSGLPRGRFMGFSANDTLRFRFGIAEYMGISCENVEAWTVGEHGRSKVNLYSTVRVRGNKHDFTFEERQTIDKLIENRWSSFLNLGIGRTAGWTTCANLISFIETLLGRRESMVQCSCVLEGELGLTGLSIGLPAKIGANGVEEIIFPDMAEDEKHRFIASANAIKAAISRL